MDVDREDVRVRGNEAGDGDGAWYCMMGTIIVTVTYTSEHQPRQGTESPVHSGCYGPSEPPWKKMHCVEPTARRSRVGAGRIHKIFIHRPMHPPHS